MTPAHVHPGPAGPGPAELVVAGAALLVTVGYLAAAGRLRRRGDVWPRVRDASFAAGGVGTAWATLGEAWGGPFTQHVVRHLVVGMAASLLFVAARPLTLALRALAPGRVRRRLVSLAHSGAVGLLLFPPVAAVLDVGGLWLLYRTDLFAAAAHRPPLHGAVQAHMVAAGLLFTFAVCGLDPVRRRWGLAVRGATLLAAGAAHAVLARTLYSRPPPGTGFGAADLHQGAQWMYYGGDLVEAGLAVLMGTAWYAGTGRAGARRRRRGLPDEVVDRPGRGTRRPSPDSGSRRRIMNTTARTSPDGPTRQKRLVIYLNDHLAGATAGVELARRMTREHHGSAYGEILESLRKEISQDRQDLVRLLADLDVPVRRYKTYGAWLGEKAARMKPNGRLLRRSGLALLIEIEALRLGAQGKASLWRGLLAASAQDSRLDADRLEELLRRAVRQIKTLDSLHARAATELLFPAMRPAPESTPATETNTPS
jgi:putative membrane protein